MDFLCRFCGLDLVKPTEHIIANNKIIITFYRLLPSEVQTDDSNLPKNCCNICYLKINQLVNFYNAVLECDRDLRCKLKVSQTVRPAKRVRLRRLSELFKYKNNINGLDRSVTPKPTSVSEIYDKLKAKGSITISKFIDSDDGIEDNEKLDSDSDYSNPIRGQRPVNISSDSEWSENENAEKSSRGKRNVKNPRIISLENMKPNYVCARCKGKFKTLDVLRHHLETNNECKDTDIVCGECKKVFKTRRVYSKHVRDVHEKKDSPTLFQCWNCDEIFGRERELQNHRVQCTGECNEDYSGILFKCKDCDKSYERRIDLVQHIENHTKQFLCETCGKSCNTKKAYSQHNREHLGLKPYKCTLCDKRFRTNTLLQAHQHVHTGVKIYVCDTCGKSFAKRASLIYHVRLHTGEKPYECNLCDDRFTTSERLKNHLRKHRQNVFVE